MRDKQWLYLQENDQYEQEYTCAIWGSDVYVYVSYENDRRDCQAQLKRYDRQVKRCLRWLNGHKADVVREIEKAGMYALALEWLDGCDLVERDNSVYYELGAGILLPHPLTPDAFFAGLRIQGMHICADFHSTEFCLDLFIDSNPDVFAYHSIEVFLKADFAKQHEGYAIEVNGLIG